jgi:two-component system chemotaxis sensor kinase CheA
MEVDQELFAIFRAEVEEQIDDLCERLARKPDRWKVDRLFQISHNVKGAARLVGVFPVRDAAHALEDLFDAVRQGLELSDEVVTVARSGAELLDTCFQSIDGGEAPDITSFREHVSACIGGRKKVKPKAKKRDEAKPEEAVAAKDEGEKKAKAKDRDIEDGVDARKLHAAQTLRVGADKLETMMGLSSELASHVFQYEGHGNLVKKLTACLNLTMQQSPQLREDPSIQEAYRLSRKLQRDLLDHATEALRLSDELQSAVRALRMVRIEGLRTILNRAVREACSATGRLAELKIKGSDTGVDRVVQEQLRDPLVHILRNAVAHGIEPPAERVEAGKNEVGQILLEASSTGPWVSIVVSDDGRGINLEKARARALETGLATRQELAELAEDRVLDLLFRAGLSTADVITELAGRGVGLDVVRSRLAELGGDASISTTPGQGTSITLRVPLTRLTTSGVLVRVGRQLFAAPTTEVERTQQIARDDLVSADGADMVSVDGQLLRVDMLATVLGQPQVDFEQKPAVVLSDGIRRRAFLVDEVCGQREYIAQPLSWNLQGTPGLAGSTVLDGGSLVLILDTRDLIGARRQTSVWTEERSVRQLRLLVVDDSATSRTLERNILRSAGYNVTTATDGEEAWTVLKKEKIDLVVSDIEMPRLNGFELTRRIRADKDLEHLPVILVTSLGSEEHKQMGAECGADTYIVKGAFDQEELLGSVARLL